MAKWLPLHCKANARSSRVSQPGEQLWLNTDLLWCSGSGEQAKILSENNQTSLDQRNLSSFRCLWRCSVGLELWVERSWWQWNTTRLPAPLWFLLLVPMLRQLCQEERSRISPGSAEQPRASCSPSPPRPVLAPCPIYLLAPPSLPLPPPLRSISFSSFPTSFFFISSSPSHSLSPDPLSLPISPAPLPLLPVSSVLGT